MNNVMEIKEIIEKSIEGGWGGNFIVTKSVTVKNNKVTLKYIDHEFDGKSKWSETFTIEQILLEPKFWQAVSKVEGCSIDCGKENCTDWKENMHQMIDALCEGKTIEEYIKTL